MSSIIYPVVCKYLQFSSLDIILPIFLNILNLYTLFYLWICSLWGYIYVRLKFLFCPDHGNNNNNNNIVPYYVIYDSFSINID